MHSWDEIIENVLWNGILMTDREVAQHLGYVIHAAIHKNGGELILSKKCVDYAKGRHFEVVERENDFVFTLGMPKHAPKNVKPVKLSCCNTIINSNFTVSFWLVVAMFILGVVAGGLSVSLLMVNP